MKKIIFYFLFVTVAFNAFPQLGPGYMGKRFMFGYGFYFSPALLGSNGSEASIIGRGNAEGGDIAFNSTHEGFFEFAFKNRTSVGFSCKYYNTTFDNSTVAYGSGPDPSGNLSYIYSTPKGFYNIRGLNYSLYFKFYNKRYVAPWGRYFLMGPVLNTYKCFYDPSTMKMSDTDYPTSASVVISNFGEQGQQYLRGDIVAGWGRNRMIGNRITVDYGINFEVIALLWTLWDTVGESPIDIVTDERTTNLNYIEKTSKRRVREVNRLNAYIKIGVLLF
jgi:hypothetical protein